MSLEESLPYEFLIEKPELLFLAGCIPIFITSPIPIIDAIIELRPLLIKGSGKPVFGKILVATQIFANT